MAEISEKHGYGDFFSERVEEEEGESRRGSR